MAGEEGIYNSVVRLRFDGEISVSSLLLLLLSLSSFSFESGRLVPNCLGVVPLGESLICKPDKLLAFCFRLSLSLFTCDSTDGSSSSSSSFCFVQPERNQASQPSVAESDRGIEIEGLSAYLC
jgi:hypothetical protein